MANVLQSFGDSEGSSRGDLRVVIHSARGQDRLWTIGARGTGGSITFPMGFAYVEAYAAARSCLSAKNVPCGDPSPIEDTRPSWLDPDVLGHGGPGDTA